MGATAVYEPGSVNKVITVAAALEEGLVTPDTELTVPDSLQVSDHLYTDHDPHPTESYSVTRILTESSNIGTIKLAQMLGKDRLDSYLRRFGFGTKTALDFPNEAAGQLLHPEDYSGTSIGSIPIGQGISVTAMQMLEAYNVLANDGVYVPPKLVHRDASTPTAQRHPVAGRRAAPGGVRGHRRADARDARERGGRGHRAPAVASPATRWPARRAPPASRCPRAATRTPPATTTTSPTSSGFVPAEEPELSIIVVIDEPAGDIYGGTVAAPVFADLAQYGLRLFRIAPPLVEQAPAPDTAAAEAEAAGHRRGPRARAGAGHPGHDRRPPPLAVPAAASTRLRRCGSTRCSPRPAAW